MKCLVFSDSHGTRANIRYALSCHRDADIVFFLGDGLRDVSEISRDDKSHTWYSVRGNCDYMSDFMGEPVKKLDEITLFGRKIVFTHGDLYDVKLSSEGLYELAVQTNADIVLSGHTHRAREDFRSLGGKGVYFFNPGSISGAGMRASYGILTIDERNVLFSVAEIRSF